MLHLMLDKKKRCKNLRRNSNTRCRDRPDSLFDILCLSLYPCLASCMISETHVKIRLIAK